MGSAMVNEQLLGKSLLMPPVPIASSLLYVLIIVCVYCMCVVSSSIQLASQLSLMTVAKALMVLKEITCTS